MKAERDLVILAADKSIELALRGLLSRPAAFKIRPLTFDVFVHPHHDPGCRQTAVELLRGFLRTHDRALVVFDWNGCGSSDAVGEIQESVESRLAANGWSQRCCAVVINPELEAWLWTDSLHVTKALGWPGTYHGLREWLASAGSGFSPSGKPIDPKDALHRCLRAKNIPRSASLFGSLAAQVSVDGCTDSAFNRLRTVLEGWFAGS
jgi:hypothetical protein